MATSAAVSSAAPIRSGRPAAGSQRLGNDADSGDEGDDRDRDIDQEDRAPTPAEDVGLSEKAAEHESERGGEAEDRAVHPERLPALLAGEDCAERGEEPAGPSPRRPHPGRPAPRSVLRVIGRDRRRGSRAPKSAIPIRKTRLRPSTSPKLPATMRVAAKASTHADTTHCSCVPLASRSSLYRRQGDVHDRDVDQVHQHRTDHHHRSEPPSGIGGPPLRMLRCRFDPSAPFSNPSLANAV